MSAGAAEFGEKLSISAVEMLTRVAAELRPTAQSLLSKGMRPQDVLRMIQVMVAACRRPNTDCMSQSLGLALAHAHCVCQGVAV